jgi:hypothetical protein
MSGNGIPEGLSGGDAPATRPLLDVGLSGFNLLFDEGRGLAPHEHLERERAERVRRRDQARRAREAVLEQVATLNRAYCDLLEQHHSNDRRRCRGDRQAADDFRRTRAQLAAMADVLDSLHAEADRYEAVPYESEES